MRGEQDEARKGYAMFHGRPDPIGRIERLKTELAIKDIRRLIEAEINLDAHHHRDGHSVFQRGPESISSDGDEGLFVQSISDGTNHARILRHPVGIDDQGDQTFALDLLFSCFV